MTMYWVFLLFFLITTNALRLRPIQTKGVPPLLVGLYAILHASDAVATLDIRPMNDARYNEIVIQANKEQKETDSAMETVPSRKVKVTMADGLKSNGPIDDFLLQSIPSYKYFKIINKEYSSRSTTYVEGEENPFAAFQ